MIISHKYKYVFIQNEKTASTAIARELVKNYNGEPILWKHARYEDFLAIATEKEKKYFIFSGIRNPLDIAVSDYYRSKHGLDKSNRNFLFGMRGNLKKIEFFEQNNSSFSEFFKKFYGNKIYENYNSFKFKKIKYLYKFENLEKEFDKILQKLNLDKKRNIPIFNKSPERKKDFWYHYTPEIQGLAKIVFLRYMRRFNYDFPDEWKKPSFFQKYILKFFLYLRLYIYLLIYKVIVISPIYRRVFNYKIDKNPVK